MLGFHYLWSTDLLGISRKWAAMWSEIRLLKIFPIDDKFSPTNSKSTLHCFRAGQFVQMGFNKCLLNKWMNEWMNEWFG